MKPSFSSIFPKQVQQINPSLKNHKGALQEGQLTALEIKSEPSIVSIYLTHTSIKKNKSKTIKCMNEVRKFQILNSKDLEKVMKFIFLLVSDETKNSTK